METEKIRFAKSAMKNATNLMLAFSAGYDDREVYLDKEFEPGGSEEIVDADIAPLELTALELSDIVLSFNNLRKFMDNEAVTQADYRKKLNKGRIDK